MTSTLAFLFSRLVGAALLAIAGVTTMTAAVTDAVRGSQVEIVPPAGDLPSIAAAAYVVVDGDTGEPLASFNADQPRPVASLTKLMTARLVLDAGQLESHRVKFGRAVVGVVRMSAPAVHAVRDGDALAH